MRGLMRLVALGGLVLAVAACGPAAATTTPAGSVVPPAGAGAAPASAAAAGAGAAIKIVDFNFDPSTITVKAGTTVTWTNSGTAPHTVTADDGSFSSQSLATGGTFQQAFATPGTFAYHCAIHPSMKASVVVAP